MWKRSWQLMALLQPAATGQLWHKGWLHPSWPIEGHHSSTCVTALLLSSPALTETTTTAAQNPSAGTVVKLIVANQYQPVKPLALLLLPLLQGRWRRRHQECFALSVIYLSLGRSQAWDQYATGSSYFTGGPAGMRGQRGRKRRRGKDGMMTWLCKALRGQSREQIAWRRNRWYGCNQRWEKEREALWRRSQ